MGKKIGRNDPCPCGSGKKYKHCCGKNGQQKNVGNVTTVGAVDDEQRFKFNNNRNSEDIIIFERYTANPAYQEKLIKLYLDFQTYPEYRKQMEELYSEVCRYANGMVPDYSEYRNFLHEKYLSKAFPNDAVFAGYGFFDPNKGMNFKHESYGIMLLPLLYAYKTEELKKYESINNNSSKHELKNAAIAYNAWKLMTSVLMKDLGYILDIMMNMCDEDNIEHMDDDLDKLNNRGLVARFFEAVSKKEKEISFKILGRVKDLDPGEAEYLEAVAYFYDQNYERAVYYGSKVAENNPDYGKAVSLLLESYAVQGKLKEFRQLIESNRSLTFISLQMLYLIQEIALNIHNYEDAIDELNGENGFSELENISEEDGNEFYEKLALNTCKSIVRLISFIKENIVYSELEIHVEQQKEDDEYTRNFLALSCVADYFEPVGLKDFLDIIENDISNQNEWLKNMLDAGFGCIGKICIDCNPTQSMELVLFALQCQYDIGLKKEFIQNIDSNIEALTIYANRNNKDEKCRNLLLLAYTEELIGGDVNETLDAYIKTNCQNEINRKTIAQKKLERKFSMNANIALESAELMFSMSEDIDWGWRDAGMLSLGFFRIIEVEINDKLILPLIRDGRIDDLKDSYDARRSALSGDDKKTYSNRWGRNIKTLEKIADGSADVDGLMLGELEFFFQNIGSSFDPDDNLAILARNRLSELIDSSIVIDEFITLIEDKVLKKEIRDRYRNPPAHTKYLPYETACECREYFYDVMMDFENAIK